MGFHEMIQQMREPGEEGLPASIYDDLTSEYSTTAQLAESASAKVQELQAQLQNRESEISRLKSTNYDLLMSSGGDGNGPPNDEPKEEAPTGIRALFDH